ncbi:MAG TPA: hypothetical protein VFZ21_12395 [Gemmatimonadaceae bacterium]|nr:hypothetical protein [Gemmatimonadaceae bacterium]
MRLLRCARSLAAVAVVLLVTANARTAPVAAARLPRQDVLPVVGGPGGTSFAQVCPTGHVLTGIRARRSTTLDAIGVRCRPVQSNGTLGPEVDVGPVWGGPGGRAFAASCSSSNVIAEQVARFDGTQLSALRYHCFRWDAATRRWNATSGRRTAIVVIAPTAAPPASSTNDTSTPCPATARPADGVRGRSGMVVDAIGIRCDLP